VSSGLKDKLQQRRRHRELAGSRRAGRYARWLAWDRQWGFVRRHWPVLSALVVLSPLAAVPFALVRSGPLKWFVVGLATATGFWCAVLMTILGSGSASRLMGVTAEEWTVDEVRPLLRRGWRLINGVMLRGTLDIDHVLVGPPGVVVIETKWSADPWPIGERGDSFMAGRLAEAVARAQNNRKDVNSHFSRALAGTPVRAAVVLWSASPTAPDDAESDEEGGGVSVVRGSALRRWLSTLDAEALDEPGVVRVWAAIEKQAEVRDRHDLARIGPRRPTFGELYWRWLVQPLVGAVAGAYAFVAVAVIKDWRVQILGFVAVAGLGVLALRVTVIRPAALGWVVACAALLVVMAVAAVALVTT
jgi:hypothetical protein